MQIEKFKKDKGNKYKVYFDDNTIITLYDDVIVKFNLLINKKFDVNFYNEIVGYNGFLDGYYKAIKYINTKMRCEKEIKKYLNKLCINNENIDKIIELLYKERYLDNERYLKAFINDQYNLTVNGPLKVKKSLNDLGYLDSEINDYLYDLDWNSRIRNIILKKIKLNHKLSNNALKSKIINDIIKLGYERDVIIDILNNIFIDSDVDILKKEMSKIKNKYSLKYVDNELEYKVVNYLYKKGFKLEDIKRCYDEN